MTPVTNTTGSSPLILAIPHSGTYVPAGIWSRLSAAGKTLADTDWHIDTLYKDLAPNASIIRANFHRYVIDANRDPNGQSLYPGQNTTGLCPLISFGNAPLYEIGKEPEDDEIAERLERFHTPYHAAIAAAITQTLKSHGIAVLYDCHSIPSHVPFLFEGRLPDFNIGTFDGQSCARIFQTSVSDICETADGFTYVTNGRFKGGWTTRHYGRPDKNVHAVQMELSQSAYMLETAPYTYDSVRAENLRPYLQSILEGLANTALTQSAKAKS